MGENHGYDHRGFTPCDGSLFGVEAMVDKDLASVPLARPLNAETLIMLSDVAAVCGGFGKLAARAVARAAADRLAPALFAAGSRGPKLQAAGEFVIATDRPAAIGRLEDAAAIVRGGKGTRIDAGTRDSE